MCGKKMLVSVCLVFLFAVSVNAAFTPVYSTYSMNSSAVASGGSEDFQGSNGSLDLVNGSAISVMANSMGTVPSTPTYPDDPTDPTDPMDPGYPDPTDPMNPGGMPPEGGSYYDPYGMDFVVFSASSDVAADGMADVFLSLKDDGLYVSGNGHAGVTGGSGDSSFSTQFEITFELDEESVLALIANSSYSFMSGSGSASSYIRIENLQREQVFNLNLQSGHVEADLTLDAGVYYIKGEVYGDAEALEYCEGMTWDSSAFCDIDVTATAVPEPATLAILGAGLLIFRRKK